MKWTKSYLPPKRPIIIHGADHFFSPLSSRLAAIKKTVCRKKNSPDLVSRTLLRNVVLNLLLKSAFNDACRILCITLINPWDFFRVCFNCVRKICKKDCQSYISAFLAFARKLGSPASNRQIVALANLSAWSSLPRILPTLYRPSYLACYPPITWSIIDRSKARRRSVAPKLWWRHGITVCKTMLRAVQNPWTTSPINLGSLSPAIIPGAPNTADQFEIATPLPFPMFVLLSSRS